jgi:hypothetical protein
MVACLPGFAAAQNTALVVNSPSGEYIGDGYYYYYTPGDGAFSSEKNYRNGVSVSFTGNGHSWLLSFAAPGKALLAPGTYEGAVRFGEISGDSENLPQMEVSGEGRAHSRLNGSFTVKQIEYGDGNTIRAFHATFSQRDTWTAGSPALTGEILFKASAPLPPDETALHPPEELLYMANGGALIRFRPNGTSAGPGFGGLTTIALAFDRRGSVYLGGQNSLRKMSFLYNTATQIPGFEQSTVVALACDKAGNLFVAETRPVPRITKITPTGTKTVFPGSWSVPAAMALDAAENLCVADNGTHEISRISPTGTVETWFEDLPDVTAMAFDAQNNLYIAEPSHGIVLKVTPQGSTGLATGLNDPRSIAIDKAGNVFIGDYDPRWEQVDGGGYQYFGGRIYKYATDGTKAQFARTSETPHDLAFAPHPPAVPVNLSTRAAVGTGQNVLIGGFIVVGGGPKKIIVRAIGPSLSASGITSPLADPVLELYDSAGKIVALNDNWRDSQMQDLSRSGLAPKDDFESAVITTLEEGAYTAVVAGRNATTGVGLLEIYDLSADALPRLANISTRSVVQTLDSVMIAGFILGAGNTNPGVVVRALGPSLAAAGIAEPLSDPTLELFDKNGVLVRSNDNWKDSQQEQLQTSGVAPTDDRESALAVTLSPGNYTAVVGGKGGSTGVGLVEVYHLEN